MLTLRDNGAGIREEKLAQLFSPEMKRKGRGGLGVRNADQKFKLHFGPLYGLKVHSVKGKEQRLLYAGRKRRSLAMMKAGNIRVMIADDESIVRKGLRSTVPWDRFGMEVVADSPNGQAAWEAFLEFRPQVVITDIVMPEMDGIELSRKVKEVAPETRIILLSCHRDFEYAQEGCGSALRDIC